MPIFFPRSKTNSSAIINPEPPSIIIIIKGHAHLWLPIFLHLLAPNPFPPTDCHAADKILCSSFNLKVIHTTDCFAHFLRLQNGTVSTVGVTIYTYLSPSSYSSTATHNQKNQTSISMAESAIVLSIAVSMLVLAGESSSKELRPSDHGLVFQISSPPAANYWQEMRSFFNSEKSSPSTSSNVALPRPMNSSDASPPSWWRDTAVHGVGDRFGKALMAASLVCGIVGAVLFVASGLIYVLKYRKHKLNAAFRGDNGDPGENNSDDNNKLQLVLRDP